MTEKAVTNNRSVMLFVPGLDRFNPAEIRSMISHPQTLPALEILRARSQMQAGTNGNSEQTLFGLFGLRPDGSQDFPVGALTQFLVTGNVSVDCWIMRADPVVIQPNRDHLLLMGNAGLNISIEEAKQVVDDINETYSDTPWTLIAVTPKQWVIQQDETQQLTTHSLPEVSGKNINDYLPAGEDEKYWRGLMNELQMFLHTHPLNQQRQMQGLTTINSLWFWGAGKLPQVRQNDPAFAQCWSNETVSLGLSRLCNVPRTDLPADAEQWLSQAITAGKHFLMLELLNDDVVKNDPLEWWKSLLVFDNQWLSPLIDALKKKSIQELSVIDSRGNCYHLTRPLLQRWWKLIGRI